MDTRLDLARIEETTRVADPVIRDSRQFVIEQMCAVPGAPCSSRWKQPTRTAAQGLVDTILATNSRSELITDGLLTLARSGMSPSARPDVRCGTAQAPAAATRPHATDTRRSGQAAWIIAAGWLVANDLMTY
jgi:hypothetical protein